MAETCNHIWNQIEDYVTIYRRFFGLLKEEKRVKVFHCTKCGCQRDQIFPLTLGVRNG